VVADDWKASNNGYRCEREGGGNGRFVSWLLAEIQPPEDGREVLEIKNNEVMGDARKVIDVCERGCVAFFFVTLLVTIFRIKSP
jgi:hypothetical protein